MNDKKQQIHTSVWHRSKSNVLETLERLLEEHKYHESKSAAEVAIRQRLEHYKHHKLMYLSSPQTELAVEGKLIQHLAELVLDWMILAGQKDQHFELPDGTYKCLVYECKVQQENPLAIDLIAHILCVKTKIVQN